MDALQVFIEELRDFAGRNQILNRVQACLDPHRLSIVHYCSRGPVISFGFILTRG